MRAYPILFEPILKPRVWGGDRLARLGKTVPPGARIGESWELADLPAAVEDGRSVIANGPLANLTLRDAIGRHERMIMGGAATTAEGGFPLLLKFLDARENLSVQVHPTPEYVRAHPGTHVKNEAWVVIDAEPGALIYRGLRPGVSADAFAAHVRAGSVPDDLVAHPARAGDCHYLPSGTCHALGAGVLVAEVQTPSDTTFRVFDWNRTGRALHVEQAIACIDFGAGPTEAGPPPEPIAVGGLRTTALLETVHFVLERLEARFRDDLPVVTNDRPEVWMVTGGTGRIAGGGIEVVLRPGTTVLLPAGLGDGLARLDDGAAIIRIALPSPIRGMLA